MLAIARYFSADRASSRGYSLIELATAILIVGLLMIPAVSIYANYKKSKDFDETYENVQAGIDSLQNYRKLTGILPCPAPLDVPRSDPTYGAPTDCRNDAAILALNPGDCAQGICVEQSIRAGLADRRVLVGALPFRLVQVDERNTYDSYGGRLVYAVTYTMTASNTFNELNGGIAIRNANGDSFVDPDGSAMFVVLSHGPDNMGAYSQSGALIDSCAGASLDVENCNDGFVDGSSSTTDSIYVSSIESSSSGVSAFDDQLAYFTQISEPVWKRTDMDFESIVDLSPQGVGIGTTSPDTEFEISTLASGTHSLRIYGDPDADLDGTNDAYVAAGRNGEIRTDQICDIDDPTVCFDPLVIAGDNTVVGEGMKCPAGTYMAGIENSGPRCIPIAVECPDTTPLLTGIDGSGNPICQTVPQPACAATTATECSAGDIALPAAADTVLSPLYSVGACRTVRYQCDSGTWVRLTAAPYAPTGNCTFTPTVSTYTGYACGAGWSGTFSWIGTSTCTGGTTWVNTFATDCTCTGAVIPETTSCASLWGSNWSGMATRTTTYTAPACTSTTSAWNTSGCNCPAQPNRWVSNGSCPSGYSGTKTREQALNTATCSWVNTGNTTNTCTCNIPNPTTRWISNGSCPSGYTGTKTKEQTFQVASCAWQDTGNTTNTCTCVTTPQYRMADHVCTDPVCEVPDVQDRWRTDINAATCTILPEVLDTAGSCAPKTFRWVDVGTSGAVAPSLPSNPNYVGQSCSCNDHKATISTTQNCFYASDGSKTIYRCKCQ